MRQQRGFTLLEAIVALVLLSVALAGAWTWIATDLRSIGRMRDLALEEVAVKEAITTLEQIDLAVQPAGSLAWREYQIEWQAAPVEEPRPGRGMSGSPSAFSLTLFSVRLNVLHRGRLISTPTLRMVSRARPTIGNESP